MWMLDEAPQRRGVEATAPCGDEQRILRTARELRSCVAEVTRDEQCRLFAERDDAILAALALSDVHALLLEIDVAEVEADRFGGAQPGRVHELDQCAVPKTERPVHTERVDEPLPLPLLRRVGQAPRAPWSEHRRRHLIG